VDRQGSRLLFDPRCNFRKIAQCQFGFAPLQDRRRQGPCRLHYQVRNRRFLPVDFFSSVRTRWRQVLGRVYSLSLEYDGCGVGRVLFSDLIVTLDCPPEHLTFVL
jgi:hypothetical protein